MLTDLRPYICTVEGCRQADEQYTSIKAYLQHEILVHESTGQEMSKDNIMAKRRVSISCPFCGMQTVEGTSENSRGPHVGKHIEEIAFTVVPQAYEDWDFYSDSSCDLSKNGRCARAGCALPKTVEPDGTATCDICQL